VGAQTRDVGSHSLDKASRLSSRLPGADVDGTQDNSWSVHSLSLVFLAAKPSHNMAYVGRSASYLHQPTDCIWQTRTQSLSIGVVLSRRTIETGVASPLGCEPDEG
jgi:hypothetical protein